MEVASSTLVVWVLGLTIVAVGAVVLTTQSATKVARLQRFDLALLVYALSFGVVPLLEYLHAFMFVPDFFLQEFGASVALSLTPYMGLAAVAFVEDKSKRPVLVLMGLSVLSCAYYQLSPTWWPINTPALQEEVFQHTGFGVYGAWLKVWAIGLFKLLLLGWIVRGIYTRAAIDQLTESKG